MHIVEHHPYLAQESLVKLAQSQKITVMAYSSFGPISFRELDWKRANECPTLFEHNVITSIAKKHNRTAAEVLLRSSRPLHHAVEAEQGVHAELHGVSCRAGRSR